MKSPIWIGGRIRAPFLVDEPVAFRPDLILWLDASRDQLLVADVLEADAPASALGEHLKSALAQNAKAPPSRVRVRDEASADAIRAMLPPEIPIEVGPTPELTAIAELMSKHMAGKGHPASYLENGRIPSAAVACMFREAEALHRLAPWRSLADSDVLEMDAPALGIAGACISIIGALEQNYGVLVFDSFDDFDEFGSRSPRGEGADGAPMDLGVEFLSLGFERGADVPEAIRREIAEHRWPVAGSRAYPLVWAVERDGHMRPLTARDMQVACAAAGGVAALVARHRRALAAQGARSVAETVTVETPEPFEVTLRFPHSALARELSPGEPPSDEARERAMERAVTQIRKFLDSPAIAALPEDWRDEAGFVCESLHRAKMDYVDGHWDGIAARHVVWFLLEHYPRKVSADARTIGRTPEILDRYFEWLGGEGLEPAPNVARLRERVARVREEFLGVAGDPEQFGPAKSFVMAMHAEGVDFSDEAAVTAFMEKHNRNLNARGRGRGDVRPKRAVRAKSGARTRIERGGGTRSAPSRGARSARRRWMPTAEHPAPGPDAACPCGSGKRYKRCCMPR